MALKELSAEDHLFLTLMGFVVFCKYLGKFEMIVLFDNKFVAGIVFTNSAYNATATDADIHIARCRGLSTNSTNQFLN